MNKCPECGKLNDDNWPIAFEKSIKSGGCQDCWEKYCDDEWWEIVTTAERLRQEMEQ